MTTYHHREDTLLHLTRIFGTKDHHFHTLEVDFDRGCGAHALGEAVSGELTGVVDDEVGLAELCELLFGGSDKHVVLYG